MPDAEPDIVLVLIDSLPLLADANTNVELAALNVPLLVKFPDNVAISVPVAVYVPAIFRSSIFRLPPGVNVYPEGINSSHPLDATSVSVTAFVAVNGTSESLP
ncbi:MAG: hypothetical protein COV29_03650 [Candidatus Yanofskybacteria bacterium CG10_big_fil_rev_8_21_14_0_10_36_16]|uniref:Uncharacterized protein n=1 Tax=Candidatus Yanofskybacteria bacterium CG10_big_fil_rev_8_21_14_0_10_36_16 TaxID=1975096 RepID=A0A2J0Q6I7_9BACT|nr:MAG: hypothetical protein COV29_03650 [Candidatus Yanofskybacteria bacterium CG10_big_fil_rev_8_21_14_0_10_36_16]